MSETFNNAFDALFDDPADIAVSKIKSELMNEIRNYIKKNRLTQEKAAELFGVTQPRISDISTGKISRFTIDALVSMLSRVSINIVVRSSEKKCFPMVEEQQNWSGLRVISGGKKAKKLSGSWETEVSRPQFNKHQGRTVNGIQDRYTARA